MHAVQCKDWPRRFLQPGHRDKARDVAEPVGRRVLAGEHGQHARGFQCGIDRDTGDPRVRVGRAHEARVRGTRDAEIIGIAPGAAQQRVVLEALDGLAEREFHGAISYPPR
jgi:hypothetical protein